LISGKEAETVPDLKALKFSYSSDHWACCDLGRQVLRVKYIFPDTFSWVSNTVVPGQFIGEVGENSNPRVGGKWKKSDNSSNRQRHIQFILQIHKSYQTLFFI
jgi:hypothetical protein